MNHSNIYAGYRYSVQTISHTVWLYHRFTLSFRDIEELLVAIRFFKRLLKSEGSTSLKIVTDKLASYSAAKKEVIPSVGYCQVKATFKKHAIIES